MGWFAKLAAEVEPWEKRLQEQAAALSTKIPSSEAEAALTAQKNIEDAQRKAYLAGYVFRKMRQQANPVESPLLPGSELAGAERLTLQIPTKMAERIEVVKQDTKKDSDYSPQQLQLGKETEKEHTTNNKLAKAIAKDHLEEIPNYYTELEKMEKESMLGAFVNPLMEFGQDVKLRAMEKLDEMKADATRTTSDPSTLPWYYPALVSNLPKNFMSGFSQAEKEQDTARLDQVTQEMTQAQKEFDQALQDEYSAAKGLKTASAGEFLDGLAQVFVKSADGELNQILGAYLAAASLMGQATHSVGYDWAAKRDPKRQELEAYQDAARQRLRAYPIPLQIETVPVPVKEAGVVDRVNKWIETPFADALLSGSARGGLVGGLTGAAGSIWSGDYDDPMELGVPVASGMLFGGLAGAAGKGMAYKLRGGQDRGASKTIAEHALKNPAISGQERENLKEVLNLYAQNIRAERGLENFVTFAGGLVGGVGAASLHHVRRKGQGDEVKTAGILSEYAPAALRGAGK